MLINVENVYDLILLFNNNVENVYTWYTWYTLDLQDIRYQKILSWTPFLNLNPVNPGHFFTIQYNVDLVTLKSSISSQWTKNRNTLC
jgi:hypothetical protein